MNDFLSHLPADNGAARRSLYGGRLYLIPAMPESLELVARVRNEAERLLGVEGPLRAAQFRFTEGEFFARVGSLRRHFYTSPESHELVRQLMAAMGFTPGQNSFDPLRLRVVSHNGHLQPAARAMFYGHRDTWYANPQVMLTWWIPLHDVAAEETFEFMPEAFATAVRNDSEIFDFDAWVRDGQEKRIGWQDRQTGQMERYSQLLEPPPGRRVAFSACAGDILLFSAQHLHQTRQNTTGQTRFSIDFRTVHLGDHESGEGPANVDNRSTGSALAQLVRSVDADFHSGSAGLAVRDKDG